MITADGCEFPLLNVYNDSFWRHSMFVKQFNSFSKKHWILSLSICVCSEIGWTTNLATDAGMCVHSATQMSATPATWCSASLTREQTYHKTSKMLHGQWRKRLCAKITVHAWRQKNIPFNICQTKTGTFQSQHTTLPALSERPTVYWRKHVVLRPFRRHLKANKNR